MNTLEMFSEAEALLAAQKWEELQKRFAPDAKIISSNGSITPAQLVDLVRPLYAAFDGFTDLTYLYAYEDGNIAFTSSVAHLTHVRPLKISLHGVDINIQPSGRKFDYYTDHTAVFNNLGQIRLMTVSTNPALPALIEILRQT